MFPSALPAVPPGSNFSLFSAVFPVALLLALLAVCCGGVSAAVQVDFAGLLATTHAPAYLSGSKHSFDSAFREGSAWPDSLPPGGLKGRGRSVRPGPRKHRSAAGARSAARVPARSVERPRDFEVCPTSEAVLLLVSRAPVPRLRSASRPHHVSSVLPPPVEAVCPPGSTLYHETDRSTRPRMYRGARITPVLPPLVPLLATPVPMAIALPTVTSHPTGRCGCRRTRRRRDLYLLPRVDPRHPHWRRRRPPPLVGVFLWRPTHLVMPHCPPSRLSSVPDISAPWGLQIRRSFEARCRAVSASPLFTRLPPSLFGRLGVGKQSPYTGQIYF